MRLNIHNIRNEISERIEEYEQIANDLAHDFIQTDIPFPTDIKKRYNTIVEVTDGLMMALNIIDKHMQQESINKKIKENCEDFDKSYKY